MKQKEDNESSRKRKDSKDEWEKSKKRTRAFLMHWPEMYTGLTDTDGGMICTTCVDNAPTKSSSFMTGCKSYRLDSIRSHWESEVHIKAVGSKLVKENENKGPLDQVVLKLGEQNKQVLIYLFNTVYFINKQERPFSDIEPLLALQVKNRSDLKKLLSYNSPKACSRLTTYIHADLLAPHIEDIKKADIMSIFFDGATDNSVAEQEIIYGRYLKLGKPHDVYLGIHECSHVHADGVYASINKVLTDVVGEEWREKVIAAGCDGASVNIGKNNSVSTRLKDGNDSFLTVHCVAHRLELAVLSSIKEEKDLTAANDILKKVYKHYHRSPKALRELKAVAEVLSEHFVRPTRLSGTRWLPHFAKASEALMAGYKVLLTHFQHVAEAGPKDASAEVRGRAVFV